MLFWRCWHLRGDVVHGKGKEPIKQSVLFLLQYEEDLKNAAFNSVSDLGKGPVTVANHMPQQPAQKSS